MMDKGESLRVLVYTTNFTQQWVSVSLSGGRSCLHSRLDGVNSDLHPRLDSCIIVEV